MPQVKNPRIKKQNQSVELTIDHVTELKKCASDPAYFIQNYIKIQHPVQGSVPFVLYQYQQQMIDMYVNNRFCITLSARQSGKSITSAAYLLWFACFNFDKTILIASNKNKTAMEMIYRIRYAYEEMPMWLKPGVMDDGWNKHTVGFDNGSRILSEATSETTGRGLSVSLLYLDEFAFVKPAIQTEFWSSIEPTLSTGGTCIVTSTPNGDNDVFAELWRGALAETNGFGYQFISWNQPPGRDEKFKKKGIGRIGIRRWKQEYECEFLSSEALLIDPLVLASLTEQIKKYKPVTTKQDFTFWEEIKIGSTYIIGIDPSTGSGEDFCVIILFEFPNMVQVGQYRSNTMSTNEIYGTLKKLLTVLERKQCTTYFSVENNGIGEGIITLYESDDNPPEQSEFVSEQGANRRGMTTTSKKKMKACINLREMVELRNMTIKSGILLNELKAFVRKRGSYNAQRGSTDDCVSACLIVVRILQEISEFENAAFEKLYSDKHYADWNNNDWDGFDGQYDQDEQGDPFII